MIEAPHYGVNGAKHKGAFALPTDYFDGTVNEPVLHQAVKVYLANQRQGTHATKTRSYVTGGNQKPWRQKGTGRARQGSTRSPLWPGGGTVFGPHPRDYRASIPKRVRQLARRSALNARAREGSLFVVDPVAFDAPKTARAAALLEGMGLAGKKVLVLTNGINQALYLSCRNLPTVDVLPYPEAAAYDVLWADTIVVEQGALGGDEGIAEDGAEGETKPATRKPAKRPAKAKAAAKRAPAAKAAPKKKKAPAAKKPAAAKPKSKKKGSD